MYLARELSEAGAKLIVTDIDAERVRSVVDEFGAKAVEPGEIYGVKADIFAPCALGAIINDNTIPQLKVEIVAGAANNVLLEPRHGDALEERNILYAPDYVANAGGVINVYSRARGMGCTARAAQSGRDLQHDSRCVRNREERRHPNLRGSRSPSRTESKSGRITREDVAAVAKPLN